MYCQEKSLDGGFFCIHICKQYELVGKHGYDKACCRRGCGAKIAQPSGKSGQSDTGRLPPERQLSEALGISRTELRKALGVLEAEGQIWRHVGKGTFFGARPIDNFSDVSALARRTNPAEMMRARLVIEPEIARAAALTATAVIWRKCACAITGRAKRQPGGNMKTGTRGCMAR